MGLIVVLAGLPALARAQPSTVAPAAAVSPASAAPSPAAADPASPAGAASPAAPDGEPPGQPVDRAERTTEPAPPASAASPQHHQARVDVGLGFARRSLEFTTRPGLLAVPPSVSVGGTSVRVDGEIYPFALANPASPLQNLGFAMTYDKTLGSKLRGVNQTDDMAVSLDQDYYTVGARYRFPLDADSAVAVGLDYVHRQSVLDRPAFSRGLDVPDVSYSALAPTLAIRAGVTRNVALVTTVDGWFAFDAGPIIDPDSYGRAAVYGFTTTAGVELALSERLALHVLLEYTRVELAFDGNGAMANARDGDPATQDVDSASDQSFGLAATLGLTY